MTQDNVRIEIGQSARTLPMDVLDDLVASWATVLPLAGFHKAQLERDVVRLHRKRGEHVFIKPGRYFLAIRDQQWRCTTLKHAIRTAMRVLHEADPSKTEELAKFAKINRHFIARDFRSLYGGAGHPHSHAAEFVPGWWVDTHHSYAGTLRFLGDVFRHYGLRSEAEWYFGRLA